MNDETENVPGETGQPAPQETQTETVPADDGTVTEDINEIPETMVDVPTEEPVLEDLPESTEETVSLTIQVIEEYGSGIIHANLFGSFLISGTLIGIVLWRKIHGT